MNDGKVFIVDADLDDREFLADGWHELNFPNELRFFKNGEELLEYLHTSKEIPFLIISDTRLPKMNGFELKKILKEDRTTNYKSIPFVFLSSSASSNEIQSAYDLCTNGFFMKETSFEGLKQQLTDIVRYWLKSKVPM